MPIRVACPSCGHQLNVADKFGGKRGKCPKCAATVDIPMPTTAAEGEDDFRLADEVPSRRQDITTKGWGQAPVRSHLDDLLDEVGVKAAVEGPVCPACGAETPEGAVICIECGLNLQTGERIHSTVQIDGSGGGKALSENEKIMLKAEAAIEDNPITQEDEGYGDGPESFLIAGGALLAGALVVAAIVGTIFLFDKLTNSTGATVMVMAVVGSIFLSIGNIWIMIAAFREHVGQGIATLVCVIYALIFGFMRMGALWVPTLCLTMGLIAAIVAGAVWAFQDAQAITS